MFDVDSKDPTLGMSCPPQAFVEKSFLQKVRTILTPEGMEPLSCSQAESLLPLACAPVPVCSTLTHSNAKCQHLLKY